MAKSDRHHICFHRIPVDLQFYQSEFQSGITGKTVGLIFSMYTVGSM